MARKRQAIRCHAKTHKGEPCGFYAMEGQLVCRKHGGMAPQARVAAKVRQGEEKARRQLARLDLPPVENALEALRQHAAVVIEWRDRTAGMVNVLNGEIRFESSVRLEQLRSEVMLWERALDRATVTLSALARCQVDERLTTIRENDARRIEGALSKALAEAGLTGDAAARARRTFVRHMTAGIAA
jgi:hypothetical protein